MGKSSPKPCARTPDSKGNDASSFRLGSSLCVSLSVSHPSGAAVGQQTSLPVQPLHSPGHCGVHRARATNSSPQRLFCRLPRAAVLPEYSSFQRELHGCSNLQNLLNQFVCATVISRSPQKTQVQQVLACRNQTTRNLKTLLYLLQLPEKIRRYLNTYMFPPLSFLSLY